MYFNSAIFLFVFLPLTLAGWYLLNHFKIYRGALVFLSLASLVFYGYFKPAYLLLILGSIAVNYLVMRGLHRWEMGRRGLLAFGVLANLGLLGYFKYSDFFLQSVNMIFHTDLALLHILLPLGISFYTIQQLSCIIDAYRRQDCDPTFIEYVSYVTFFPQLIAGPIVLSEELIPQFRDTALRRFDPANFAQGLSLFIMGLGKKMLIADVLGRVVDFGYEKIYWIDTASAWVVALCYIIQLYFDFSGYCDMARGLGRMFNFTLPENFKQPLKAHSVKDFWARWHLTLTRFFTKYVYIPLGGSRKGAVRTCLNIMIVFLVSGLWHGAAITFVIWGGLHGLGVLFDRRKHSAAKDNLFFRVVTFLFLTFSFMIFRCGTVDFMCRMLRAMFIPKGARFLPELCSCLAELPEFYMVTRAAEVLAPGAVNVVYMILLGMVLLVAGIFLAGKCADQIVCNAKEKGYPMRFVLAVAFVFTCVVVSLNQVSSFLYFNF